MVHVNERRAPRSPILEPLLITTVDLDQIMQARSAMPRRLDALTHFEVLVVVYMPGERREGAIFHRHLDAALSIVARALPD